MRAWWAAGIGLLLVSGCGGSEGPTTPTPRIMTTESTSEGGPLAAGVTGCVSFRQDAAGAAEASVGLRLPIEMGSGACPGGAVVARSEDGFVATQLPIGPSFARFQNTGGEAIRYRITIRYLLAF